jgi:hypothetical protein
MGAEREVMLFLRGGFMVVASCHFSVAASGTLMWKSFEASAFPSANLVSLFVYKRRRFATY